MRPRLFLFLTLLALLPRVDGFPPAPSFTFCGIARDSSGFPLRADAKARVIVRRGDTIVGEALVSERANFGENFRLAVPIDLSAGDAYSNQAQSPGSLISFTVRFSNGTEEPVLRLTVGQRTIGQPGGKSFIDFTLGADTDQDGLPDNWEFFQLVQAGIDSGDPRYNLATFGHGDFDKDGRSDLNEYRAGTFAGVQTSFQRLLVHGESNDGYLQLLATVVGEKRYRIETSIDMVNWVPVEVFLKENRKSMGSTFVSHRTEELLLEAAPLPVDPNSNVIKPDRFFRFGVQ